MSSLFISPFPPNGVSAPVPLLCAYFRMLRLKIFRDWHDSLAIADDDASAYSIRREIYEMAFRYHRHF